MVVPSGQIHAQKKRPKESVRRSTIIAGQYFEIKVFAAIIVPTAERGLIRRNILTEKSLSVSGSKKRSK
jgi:hypothetical protein